MNAKRMLCLGLLLAGCACGAATGAGKGGKVKSVAGDGKGNPEVVAAMQPGNMPSRTAEGATGMTYQVYVPTTFKADAPPPVIIAFSPGGSGKQMVNSLKESAEKAGWLLVGCDKLKNGMKDDKLQENMEDEVLADILGKLPHNPKRIYLAGLSGGASRAYGITARRKEKFAGVLAYGGWLGGDAEARKPYCNNMAVAIINGDKDAAANSWAGKDGDALKRRRCHVKPFSFPGGHVMAPAAVTDKAIAWLEEDWKKSGSKHK